MASSFEELINGMVNVGFGFAATAAEKGKEVLEDLNAKGEAVRSDASSPDFARSMSDIFERAGGVFGDASDRLSAKGDTAAERILDELIIARIRQLPAPASMSDIFERAGGVFGDASDRLSAKGDTAAERILDELIIARIRQLPAPARAAFVSHVQDLVRAVESETVKVPVESVETVAEDAEQDDPVVVADDADVRE